MAFLKQFFKDARRVGSITPSSRFLTNKMLAPIDFSQAQHIVELGAGTGCFTRCLLKNMHDNATLTVIECNPAFCAALRTITDQRLHVIEASAEQLSSFVNSADYVLSGLPLASLGRAATEQIVQEIQKVLKGTYVQFQYSPYSYPLLKKYFSVELAFTPLNLPPAFVYCCKN